MEMRSRAKTHPTVKAKEAIVFDNVHESSEHAPRTIGSSSLKADLGCVNADLKRESLQSTLTEPEG